MTRSEEPERPGGKRSRIRADLADAADTAILSYPRDPCHPRGSAIPAFPSKRILVSSFVIATSSGLKPTLRRREHLEVLADDRFKADEKGAAHQGVADRDFVEVRQVSEADEVRQVEIVAGVDAQSQLMGESRCHGVPGKARFKRFASFFER